MEAQPNGYVSELKNELIEMLEVVIIPQISEIHEQCIYKVPQRIRQTNPQAYTPQIISIGPFHNPHSSISDNKNLQEMEELKLKYLKEFINRTNLSVDDLVIKLQEWENKIRNCYAGLVSLDSKHFLKIIIVDACFIIEHFLRYFSYSNWRENDPIFLKPGLFHKIECDLLLLENQLPFFVLEEIFKLANINPQLPSFITITMHYFKQLNQQNLNSERMCPKHFIDLLRTFLLPSSFDFVPQETRNPNDPEKLVYSVTQLSEAGLKFEASERKCVLDLKLDKDVLKIPCFNVYDTTETYMRNILAFEECHISDQYSTYISQYLHILDFLINTEDDVSKLVDKKIIVNWMGDANSVATMVNSLCKIVTRPKLNSKYLSLCRGLNDFYEIPKNKFRALFEHEYKSPWKMSSTIITTYLFMFTLIQTVCSIWSLVK